LRETIIAGLLYTLNYSPSTIGNLALATRAKIHKYRQLRRNARKMPANENSVFSANVDNDQTDASPKHSLRHLQTFAEQGDTDAQ
jgi:hypothetical protein